MVRNADRCGLVGVSMSVGLEEEGLVRRKNWRGLIVLFSPNPVPPSSLLLLAQTGRWGHL